MNYPRRELQSSRPLRTSALYDRLRSKGAVFGSKFGWERPNYFDTTASTTSNITATNTSNTFTTSTPVISATEAGSTEAGAAAQKDTSKKAHGADGGLTFGRPSWFEAVRREHLACRESVAVFDQSSFAKLLVTGRDAARFLERVCSNRIESIPVGKLVYTGLLNEQGGMESDCTITRVKHDEFLVVTSTAQATRDADWLCRNIITRNADSDAGKGGVGGGGGGGGGGAEFVSIVDVTSAYSVLSVMGPRSRELLSRVTTFDLGNGAFPFGSSQLIDVGYATVRASRITYVGELGWELYIPTEMATYVYDTIINAAAAAGTVDHTGTTDASDTNSDINASTAAAAADGRIPVVDGGYFAIDSLRIEKGYKAWGHDLSSDWSPYQCGLGFAVKTKKAVDFIGKARAVRDQAAMRQQQKKPLQGQAQGQGQGQGLNSVGEAEASHKGQLITFSIDDGDVFPWGGESILFNGETVGFVTSAAYGFSLGRGVVMAMVKRAGPLDNINFIFKDEDGDQQQSGFEIEVNGTRFALTAAPGGGTQPLFDPSSSRIKA